MLPGVETGAPSSEKGSWKVDYNQASKAKKLSGRRRESEQRDGMGR